VTPILETPRGGDNILSGIGLFTGRINPRASALLWRSGETSLVTDVKIMGGGGTPTADGKSLGAAQARSGDPVADGRWDAQYPSIWVTDGGGGTFANVWSPNTFASAGFYISDTSTPGHIYEVSVEHHVRNEFVLDNVQNWEFLAPQTEQEVGDGPDAVSLEIRNSRNILFANYHGYRVTRSYHPAETAVKLFNSSDIRFRNVHINAESGVALCGASGCGTYCGPASIRSRTRSRTRPASWRCASASSRCWTSRATQPAARRSTARRGSWRPASGRSRARRWARTARSISSRSASNGSIAGRRPRGWRSSAITRWTR
jgi:hypothetical protein